jgi:hypothetical protein
MTRATRLLFRAARLRPARPTARRLALDSLEDRTTPAALVMDHHDGLALAGTSGFVPPDSCGAAGTNRYVETVNQDVRLSNTLGVQLAQDSFSHFFFTTGGLTQTDSASFLSDPIVTWNDQYQRFIIGDQDVDAGTIGYASTFHLAVSKTASPTTLSATDWYFYSINTTEDGGTANTTFDADYPGNFGYNHDAFVFTLNMFPIVAQSGHVQVNSVKLSDLVNGTLTAFRNDVNGLFSLRPTVMHDSVTPGDPMWLVSAGGGNQIAVTKMTNVLSNAATFTTTALAVNPYTDVSAAPPLNPDGSVITFNIDSRILKAAETGGMLVASHAVTNAAGDRVDARWYEINLTGATPTLADQGSVSAGANTYSFYPGVDINAAGDIGMTFMRSSNIGVGSEFMSTYVTGRQASDPPGTMQTPVLTKAGLANNFDGRAGDLSGINVAPDGTFWATNEYATADNSWGTDVQHFVLDGRPVVNGDQDNTGENDTIRVRIDAANPALLDVYVNSATPTYSLPIAALNSLVVNGQGGTDTLIVDYSNGPIPVPISYDGGPGPGDGLVVTGYTGGTVRSTYTGPHTGKVVVGAGGPITYANLAPLTLSGTATDLIFDLPAGSNPDANLGDDGGPGDPDATNDAGFSALSGSTFEYTEFANPTGSLTVNLGGAGDTLTLAPMDVGFAPGAVSVNGGAGSDTIVGDDTGRTFTITGANTGTIGWVVPVAFTSVENLVAGSGDDTFQFAAGGSLTGTVNGGGGTNSVTGDDVGDAFAITGANAGSINTLLPGGFSNIQNLVGGTGNDSFTFVTGGTLSGTIDGGAGTDTVTGDNAGDAFAITGANAGTISTLLSAGFSNVENLVGGTGNDSFTFVTGGSLAGTIDGGAGSNTITGDNAGDIFFVTGANAGSINTLLPGGFSNIQNLVGGTGNETFSFAGGSLSGNIDGGGGTINSINGDNTGRTFTINAANGGTIGGVLGGTFSNISDLAGGIGPDTFQFVTGGALSGNIDGSGFAPNTLVADDVGRTFTLTFTNGGTLSTILGGVFSNIANLTGGTGSDSFAFAGGRLTGTIDGGAGTNTVTGDNAGDAFSVTGANAGSIATLLPAGFANVENLVGGSGNDSFVLAGGSLSGTIDGAAGTNTVTGDNAGDAFAITGANAGSINTLLPGGFSNIQNLAGGTGGDAFTFATGGSLAGTIDGGAGSDTITGDNTGDAFSIAGANAGTIGALLPAGFGNVENVTGGTGNDSFTFVAPGSLSGSIDGGAGTNTITGDDAGRTFSITGANSGTISILLPAGFSNIENLTGGTGADTIQFVNGGSLAGNIDGGAGIDTLIGDDLGRTFLITGPDSGLLIPILGGTFVNTENLTGGTGNDTFQFVTGGSLSGTINGGGGTDTIIGDNTGRTFTITGPNSGTISGIGSFVGFANLAGGIGNDRFVFAGGSLTGTIDGGGGANTVTGDNAGDAFAITGVNAGSITTLLPGGFSNIQSVIGGTGNDSFTFVTGGALAGAINGGAGTDSITGDNAGDAFSVTGANAGSITTLLAAGFSNVEKLVGGTGTDSFTFAGAGSLAGTIDGGAGTNAVTGNNAGDAFSITGTNSGTINTLLSGGFVNIENLVGGTGGDSFTFVTPGSLAGTINGGAGTDTITGNNAGDAFSITGANAGSIATLLAAGFSNVENLVGGTGGDTFQFTTGGTLAGTINGGAGSDTITGDNAGHNFTLTGANAGTVGTILTAGFTAVENLTGGNGNDNFQFNAGGSLSGNINGGGGNNTIVGDNTGRTYTIAGANSGTVSTLLGGTFSNIQNVTAGNGNDTIQFNDGGSLAGNANAGNGVDNLIGDSGGRLFTLTGGNSGTLSTILGGTFSGVNNIIGGAGNDTVQFANGGSLTGTIDGGVGSDTIIGDNTGRAFTVSGPNSGTVSTILGGSFGNVENLTGGSANDQFTFNGGGTLAGNIDGGGGTNSLTGDNTGRTYTINAANGGTIGVLLGGTFANIENLTAGSGNDTFQFVTPGSLAGNIDGGAGADTIVGDNTGRTFTLTGANTGTIGTILGGTFASVENLAGGSGGDTLVVQVAGSLTGSFDGKAGPDAVDLSALPTAQSLTVAGPGTIDGFNVSGSPVAGGLLDINGLTASAAIGDTLTGLNANTLWTLTGVNIGTYEDVSSTRTMSISGFEDLSGGSATDQFVFADGGSLTGTVAGNAGTDTVQGDGGGRTFAVTGAGSGTVSGILTAGFTGIENLVGGAGADILAVAAAGSLAGSFDGLGGTDTADLSALASQQIAATGLGAADGFNTTGGTAVAGGLFNLDSLFGSLAGSTDSLTGLDSAGAYTVSGANAGGYQDNTSARTLAFANVENLTGGTAADTLVEQAAGFLGGAFDGKGGYDTADLSALPAQSPVIANVGATDGYNLTGLSAVGGGLLDLDQVIGSAAATTDNLTGRNVAATWTVDAANAGHYVDTSARTLDFSNFENLTGGTGNDKLVMTVGGGLAGSFDGGLGVDTGDFSALGAQAFVAAALGSADGFNVTGVPSVVGGLKDVDALVGSTAGTTDSLTGMNTTSTFTVTGANAGSYQDNASARTMTFAQVESLDGGTANDTLVVKVGGNLTGSFDGGAGTDTADLSALAAVQSISILALGGTDGFNTTGGTTVSGGLFDVDKVIGGKSASATLGASDRLTGLNADATWQVKAGADQSFYQDVGSGRKLGFAGFEELYGGTQKDSVTVDFSAGNPLAATGITVDGQAGSDSLSTIGTDLRDVFSLGTKVFKVNGHVIRYKNFEKLSADGGKGNDWFYAPNATLPSMVGLVSFNGGDGNDLATVSPTVLAVLHLDGGAGTDTLNLLRGTSRFLAPIPAKSATSGTYLFSNRKALEFISFEIRNIGIAQPQP